MKRLINRKILKRITKKQQIAICVFAALLLVGGSILASRQAFSAAGSPTKSTTDLSGNKKVFFDVGEQGYLDLKVFADSVQETNHTADIVLLLDGSGSMDEVVSGTTTRLDQAKDSLKAFVNKINLADKVRLSLVVYGGTGGTATNPGPGVAVEHYPLTEVNTEAIRTTILGKITELDTAKLATLLGSTDGVVNRGTGIGTGINQTITSLTSASDRGASRAAILFTDGQENQTPYVNKNFFSQTVAGNASTAVAAGSSLESLINSKVSLFTIHFGATGNICGAYDGMAPDPMVAGSADEGCALMRYAATKANFLTLPAGKTYLANYGQATGIDGEFFYKTASATELNNIYEEILPKITYPPGVPIKVSEKLASNASYGGFVSAKDSGGTLYIPAETTGSNGEIVYQFPAIPKTYICDATKADCVRNGTLLTSGSNSGKYEISNNYLTIKMKFSALGEGKFDMDSNYNGCDVGKPVATGSWLSKLEYQDPKNSNSVYATKNFPALCMEFSNGAIVPVNIMKTTYSTSQTLDDLDTSKMKAYFEAGDTVFTVLEVVDSSQRRADFEILDELPNSASGNLVYKITREGDGKNFTGSATIYSSGSRKYFRLTPSADDIKSPAYLLEGKTIIQYEYKI